MAATDGCWLPAGDFAAEPQTFSRDAKTLCNRLYPSFGFPRLIAGGPLAADVLKCQLKPIDPKDYAARLTAADLARLRHIFPTGVCDWSKPGVAQTTLVPGPRSVRRGRTWCST